MTHTKGSAYRKEQRHTEEKKKWEVLRLWQVHVTNREISRRTGISEGRVSAIIRRAMTDGEIEEKRIIHDEVTK